MGFLKVNIIVIMLIGLLIFESASDDLDNYFTYSDSEDFQLLITSGYRPSKNVLAKHLVSIALKEVENFFGGAHNCAGSIYSKYVILTAAHCFFHSGRMLNPADIKIVAGTPKRLEQTSSTQCRTAYKIKPHPRYEPGEMDFDVGLLFVDKELSLDASVDKIPITNSRPYVDLVCYIIGWGRLFRWGPLPNEIVMGNLQLRAHNVCSVYRDYSYGMLCAANPNDSAAGACLGDSGGPLICNGKVFGIASFGRGCGEPNYSTVFTSVYQFRKWIIKNCAGERFLSIFALVLTLAAFFLVFEKL